MVHQGILRFDFSSQGVDQNSEGKILLGDALSVLLPPSDSQAIEFVGVEPLDSTELPKDFLFQNGRFYILKTGEVSVPALRWKVRDSASGGVVEYGQTQDTKVWVLDPSESELLKAATQRLDKTQAQSLMTERFKTAPALTIVSYIETGTFVFAALAWLVGQYYFYRRAVARKDTSRVIARKDTSITENEKSGGPT